MQKRNSSTKNGTVVQKMEQWYKNTLFPFCSVVEKTEQRCRKRNSGTKTHCSVFVLLWKKLNSGAKKNGTVVHEHTVPFLWKNGTVVQKMEQ